MQKVRGSRSFTIAGRRFELDRSGVERAVRRATPEPLRDHFVVVAGRRYPPKQALALATGVDRADFTTNQARSVLGRLGFSTGRLSSPSSTRPSSARSPTPPPYPPEMLAEAEELRPHRGRWVALKEGRVLIAAEDPREILRWLEVHDLTGDGLFRVPLDPTVDIGGFAS